MTVVLNVLTDASGRPLQKQVVRIQLRAPGNPFTELGSEVLQTVAVDTDSDGRWEADLIPNDQLEQDGTWYHVDERDGLKRPDGGLWDFRVPEFGGPYALRDLLITPPPPGQEWPPVPPHALGDHTDVDTTGEAAGRVLKFNGTAWVPAVDSGGSGGGAFEMLQVLPNNATPVPHQLGYRPAGIRLFSADWQQEYDEFGVIHDSADHLTVWTDDPFTGWVTVS